MTTLGCPAALIACVARRCGGEFVTRPIQKLNVAWAEHPARVQIDSFEWSRIEDAYGSLIPNAVREEIQSLTNRFLEFGMFELTAAPVADAIRRITALDK